MGDEGVVALMLLPYPDYDIVLIRPADVMTVFRKEDNKTVNQSVRTTSVVPAAVSIIALVTSVMALICMIFSLIISKAGNGQGGTATAITNSAALSVIGMILFTAFAWIFAVLGEIIGFIMLTADIVMKRTDILWMPVAAMVLGVISMVISFSAF